MVDMSPNRNFFNPQTATHSIFLFKPKTTEKTPLSNTNSNSLNNVKNLQDIHRTNLFHQSHDDNKLGDNLGKRQAINLNGESNRIIHHDHSENKNIQGSIKISKTDGNHKKKHDRTNFNPSLPVQTLFPHKNNDNIPNKQIIVQHSINIVQPNIKGNKVPQNHDLPSAASTQSQGGGRNNNKKDFNQNNNNRDRFNLDYLDVDYVNRDMNIDVTSPSSEILTLMHQIHPTYIPRTTTLRVSTARAISNPLLNPNFQPIGSTAGKRWSVKKRENKIANRNNEKTKNDILKASNFPDLPSLDPGKSCSIKLNHLEYAPCHFSFVVILILNYLFDARACFQMS